ncbi:DUF3892 domain-containing protein [Pseudomonas syringae]|nr:DUF3892 domain-containing protein [Pseudomonas syringae]
MTDFCISAVRYDNDGNHIQAVRVHQDKGSSVGPALTSDREFVADLILLGKASFQTITKDSNNKWQDGALIHVLDGKYLSTDPNSLARDNLGKLPRF